MTWGPLHWRYLAVVFLLSYAGQAALYATGGIESAYFPLLMLIPAAVAVAFRIARKEGFRNVGWGLRRWWYVAPALVVPVLIAWGIGALLTNADLATLSGKPFVFGAGAVEVHGVRLLLGNTTQSMAFFALNFLLSLLAQSVLGSVVTIGEEFGWRGYVQEKLIRRFGLGRGLALLGVIWGYWHLPIGLMGWNFPTHRILGAFVLTPISTLFLGIFLGWLYLRSQSIWLPTLAHAAINLTASILFMEVTMLGSELALQLLWIAAWGVVALPCLLSLRWKSPNLWQGAVVDA